MGEAGLERETSAPSPITLRSYSYSRGVRAALQAERESLGREEG